MRRGFGDPGEGADRVLGERDRDLGRDIDGRWEGIDGWGGVLDLGSSFPPKGSRGVERGPPKGSLTGTKRGPP